MFSHHSHDVIKEKKTSITTICHMQKTKTLTTNIGDCIDFEDVNVCMGLGTTHISLY
jgi:hypothetical protein